MKNNKKVFITNKTKVKIKSDKIQNSRVRIKTIAKEKEYIKENKIQKKKEKKTVNKIKDENMSYNFYFNEKIIHEFICNSYNICLYLKNEYLK